MMIRIARAAACVVLYAGLMGSPVHAEGSGQAGDAKAGDDKADKPDEKASLDDVFGRYGFTKAPASITTKASCRVQFDLDQKTFVPMIPALQKLGLLNPDLTQTKINTSPNMISLAFMMQMLPFAVKQVYDDHPDVDRCQFAQYLTTVDDYGNNKRGLAASFGFTRATYAKINWDNFEAAKLSKVAVGFRYTPDFMRAVMAERGQSDE